MRPVRRRASYGDLLQIVVVATLVVGVLVILVTWLATLVAAG